MNMKKQILQQLVSENGDIEKLIMDMGLEYWKGIRIPACEYRRVFPCQKGFRLLILSFPATFKRHK